jgi:hypothetical protein
MNNIFNINKRGFRKIEDFEHLIGQKVSEIILFDDGSDELLEQGRTILPRYCTIFEGTRDGEHRLKPYEFDPNRIVVSTYKGIIMSIDSIG